MKKYVLRMIAVICVCSLLFGLVGCGAKTASKEETAPTEAVTAPTEEATTPSTEATEATNEVAVPTTEAAVPTTETTVPTTVTTTPTTEATVPTTEATVPTTEATVPAAEATVPTTEATVPTAEATVPTTEATVPTTEATVPTTEATVPTAEATVPTTETTVPTTVTTTPTTEATVPTTEATVPTTEATVPTTETTVPTTEATVPTNEATVPTTEATVPSTEATAPTVDQGLIEAKETAKAALDTYVKAEDYREAQKAQLTTAIANGKVAIDAATDKAGVDAALAAAKLVIDGIETDAQITAKSPVIKTPFDDSIIMTNNRATLDVYAKDASGNKLPYSKVSVMVNGIAATINWDDVVKTSYNFVFEEGENTVVITATDGEYTTTVTYIVICNLEAATTITVAIEGFTVGLGYIVEPYKLVLDEVTLSDMASIYGYADAAEMKQYLSAAHTLDYTLRIHGLEMSYQGSLHSTWNGFYMSSISGVDTSEVEVPEVLYEALDANGFYVDTDPDMRDTNVLCEFDFTWGSGWMYMVNNSFPNIPFCDYVPQDGDVMRVQFTLAYGADLGDWGMMGEPYFDAVDKDELTECIADAIVAGVDYSDAMIVVSTFGVSQEELDATCEELREKISR